MVARITFLGTPDLAGGFGVTPKRSHAGRREDRGEDPVPWPGLTEHQAMGIHDKPADIGFLEMLFDPRRVGAFRQPDPARITPETGPVMIAGDHDLGAQ